MDPDVCDAAAMGFLLAKLEQFVSGEWIMQEDTKKAVRSLEVELRTIEALVSDATSKVGHDDRFRVWIQEVRDQAYDIEHVLDLFIFEQKSIWRRFRIRHSLNNLIEDIEKSLQIIQQTKERNHSVASAPTRDRDGAYRCVRLAPLFKSSVHNVGIEEPTTELVSWALERKQRLEVMFVVGMAGLGKTTLVYSVFGRVEHHFDCHVWICASKSKTKSDILWTLLVHGFGCSVTQGVDDVALTRKLRNYLHDKRYVIVLDDLSAINVWESTTLALPDDGNDSRIFITTRRGDIANSCRDHDFIHIHQLQPLSPQRAEQLFYKTAFLRNDRCPSGLEEVSKAILEKCDGLPLGIVEIGEVLSSKAHTKNAWKRLYDNLESGLSSGELSDIWTVLSGSYRDLPYHLKYCFLYMSIFPDSQPVKRGRLIRLWIAEGFVKEKSGMTLEEVGEEYLTALIDRNLIKTSKMDFDGRPKSVGVHSLMLTMILSLSREENFCTVCTGSSRSLMKNTRRLSIQKEDFDVPQDLPHVLAYFSFDICTIKIGSSFKLLKVVDIQGTPLKQFPSAITHLLLLRYLNLRETDIRSIPRSLSNLHHLETLDLKQTLVTKVPKAVLKLKKLRHLLVSSHNMETVQPFDIVQGFKAPKSIGTLRNLEKLSFVKAGGRRRISKQHRLIQGLNHLTQLGKLGIVELATEDGMSLCKSIEKMRNLHSLSVASLDMQVLELDAMTDPPFLQRLYLRGHLERFPQWISSLYDLVRIRLQWSSLTRDNPIGALQDLPNLMELQLLDAYSGKQLVFKSRKFQKLKILDLQQLKQLSSIIMEEGTLPCLQNLTIGQCSKLEQVPRGIDNLSHLQELRLNDMPEPLVSRLRKNGGQSHR